jgi:transposase
VNTSVSFSVPINAAAEACAVDRQTLCDWVHRYNELGVEGLFDRPRRNGPRPRLSAEQWTYPGFMEC